MCDYSLHHVASRPAKVGDKLVTTQFNNSITRGFAAVGEPNVAVCLLPGTEVAFEKKIEFERGFGLFSNWKREKTIGDKVARFRGSERGQAERASRCTRIPNGEIVLVDPDRERGPCGGSAFCRRCKALCYDALASPPGRAES